MARVWHVLVSLAALASIVLLLSIWSQHAYWTTSWKSIIADLRDFGEGCEAASGIWSEDDTFAAISTRAHAWSPLPLPLRSRLDAPQIPDGGYLIVRCAVDLSELRQYGYAALRVGSLGGDSAVFLDGTMRQTLDDNKTSEFPLLPHDRHAGATLVVVSKRQEVPGLLTGPASLVPPIFTDQRSDLKKASRIGELFLVEVPVFRIGYATALVLVFAVVWLAGVRNTALGWMAMALLCLALDHYVLYQPLEEASAKAWTLQFWLQLLTPFILAGFIQAFVRLGARVERYFERVFMILVLLVGGAVTVLAPTLGDIYGPMTINAFWIGGSTILSGTAIAALRAKESRSWRRAGAWTALLGGVCYGLNVPLMTAKGVSFVPYAAFALVTLFGVALAIDLAATGKAHQAAREELARQEAIARTTQMLAHDVRKPFRVLHATLEAIAGSSQKVIATNAETYLAEVRRAMDSVEGLIEDVLELGRDRPIEAASVDPAGLLRAVLEAVFRHREGHDVVIVADLHHSRPIAGEERRLMRVLTNIIENGVQAMHGRGTLFLATSDTAIEERPAVEVAVGNDGPDIAAEDLPNLFRAFFTKGKSDGTGLGLAIVEKLVRQHGGRIRVESEQGRTSFRLTLPAALETIDAASAKLPERSKELAELPRIIRPSRNTGNNGDGELIIIVDDDVFIREAWLDSLGGRVDVFAKPEDLLTAIAADPSYGATIGCAVVDLHFDNFSDFDGERLAVELLTLFPKLTILLSSDSSPGIGQRDDLFAATIPKMAVSREVLERYCQPGRGHQR